MMFKDRSEAGRLLATRLAAYAKRPDVLVLALPRGGVPVAFEVAQALNAPLDVFVVRKLGLPGHEELAMGAIASGGVQVINRDVIEAAGVTAQAMARVVEREQAELARREHDYRGDRPALDVAARTVIVVDDGLATGASMRAAVAALRQMQPRRIVVAVPTAAAETCRQLRDDVDEVVCATLPQPFYGVGLSYENFSQTSDAEVRACLAKSARRFAAPPDSGRQGTGSH